MYKSLIVGVILAALYVFGILYFADFISTSEKVGCGVAIVAGLVIYLTNREAWIQNGRFWLATIIMLIACIIILAIGAQGKIDAPAHI